ncbi:MAG: hypothetical protein ACHQVS_02355 [Candidatus Babeliales bacterium]
MDTTNTLKQRPPTSRNLYCAYALIASILLCAGTTFWYFHAKTVVHEKVTKQLADTIDERTLQIRNYIQSIMSIGIERAQHAKIIEASEKLTPLSAVQLAAPETKSFIDDVNSFLEEKSTPDTFRNSILIAPDGRVVYSDFAQSYIGVNLFVDKGYPHYPLAEAASRILMTFTPDVSEFDYDPVLKRLAFFVCIPIFKNNVMIGILAQEIQTPKIYTIIQNYIDLGKTGEVIIGKQIHDGVIYISKTRFDNTKPFKLFFPFEGAHDQVQVPMLKAALGHEGEGIKLDRHHHKTLAAWQYVPKTDWGIVAKIDLAEVDGSLWYLHLLAVLFGYLSCICFMVAGYMYGWFIRAWEIIRSGMRNKNIRFSIKIGVLILSVGLLIGTLIALKIASHVELKRRKSEISHAVHNTLKNLTHSLNALQLIGESIATDLNTGLLPKEDIIKRLNRDMKEHHLLYEIQIAYEPYAYSKDTRLYAPLVIRHKNGTIETKQLEKSFDYTTQSTEVIGSIAETWAWYNEPLKQNKMLWFNPYKDVLEDLYIAGYSIPFYDPADTKHEKPIGIVCISFDVKFIQDGVFQLDGVTPGYSCLLSDVGTFIYQTSHDYVVEQKTIFDMAQEISSKKLYEIGKKVLAGDHGYFSYENNTTQESMWAYFEIEPISKWALGLMFSADEVQLSPIELRHYYMLILLCFLLILLITLWIIGPIWFSQAHDYAYTLSILLFTILGILFFIIRITPVLVPPRNQLIVDDMHLQSILRVRDLYAEEIHENKTIDIPFGIQIYTADITADSALLISGYVWEKYPKDIDKNLVKEPQFPQAIGFVNIHKTYEMVEGDFLVIGWQFNTKMAQQFDFSKYPLDVQDVTIAVEHPDFSKNIMLIPSFDDYYNIQPTKLPGLYQDVLIPGYIIKETFFSFETDVSDTTMGLKAYEDVSNRLWLSYNMILARDLWYDFILFMLPILIIFFSLYTVFSIWERDEKISTLTALTAYSGLIFTAIVLHGNFRRQHEGSGQLLYIEYLFFMLYLAFIMFVLYAMLKLYKSRLTPYFSRFFAFYRVFFWPVQLGLFILITLVVFYTE